MSHQASDNQQAGRNQAGKPCNPHLVHPLLEPPPFACHAAWGTSKVSRQLKGVNGRLFYEKLPKRERHRQVASHVACACHVPACHTATLPHGRRQCLSISCKNLRQLLCYCSRSAPLPPSTDSAWLLLLLLLLLLLPLLPSPSLSRRDNDFV